MTLYDIDQAIENFEFEVDEETGEILNAQDLDELKMAREDKIEGVGLYIKNLEAEAAALKAERDNLYDRQKRKEKKAEGLRNYLAYALQGEKFETPKIALSWRKSESVNVWDEYLIPDKYINMQIVKKPDKTMIKKALKDGTEIQGAELITKNNLQIK